MNTNTMSVIIALLPTSLFPAVEAQLIYGQVNGETFFISLLIFAPLHIILFALFYLVVGKILHKKQASSDPKHHSRNNIATGVSIVTSCFLPKAHVYMASVAMIVCLGGIFIKGVTTLIFILLFMMAYVCTTPYRVDLMDDDTLVIFKLFRKQIIRITDIQRITKGRFRDKIEYEGGYIYFDHIIPHIGSLTQAVALKTETSFPTLHPRYNASQWPPPAHFGPLIGLMLLVFLIVVLSVFGVFYVKELFTAP